MSSKLAKYAWLVLAMNIGVVLWGAYVRASGSGAGCGDHWPLCNGQVIPLAPATETIIEFAHRITSGLALIAVVLMLVWARRALPSGHLARAAAWWSLAAMIIESLIGALIVLAELTGANDSTVRAAIVALHLANTLLLLGAITLTAWWAGGGPAPRWREHALITALLIGGMLGMVVIGSSGAVTALGDTLFRPATLAQGLQENLETDVHLLVRLRVLHPVFAAIMGAYVVALGWLLQRRMRDAGTRRLALGLTFVYATQGLIGLLNVALLAPVAVQIVHLLFADAVWVLYTLLCAQALAYKEEVRPLSEV